MIERRKYPRYSIPLNIRYSTIRFANVEASAPSVNISQGGVRMSISRFIKVSDKLKLEIDLLDENHEIRTMGQVVWTREIGTFELDAGIQFNRLDDIDSKRLAKFLITYNTV